MLVRLCTVKETGTTSIHVIPIGTLLNYDGDGNEDA